MCTGTRSIRWSDGVKGVEILPLILMKRISNVFYCMHFGNHLAEHVYSVNQVRLLLLIEYVFVSKNFYIVFSNDNLYI